LKAFNFGQFAIKLRSVLITVKIVNVFVQYKGLQNKFYFNYKLFERKFGAIEQNNKEIYLMFIHSTIRSLVSYKVEIISKFLENHY
jgi:hypothetical protein